MPAIPYSGFLTRGNNMRAAFVLAIASVLLSLAACGGGNEEPVNPDMTTQPVHCQQAANSCT
jgi:hypothetical protein